MDNFKHVYDTTTETKSKKEIEDGINKLLNINKEASKKKFGSSGIQIKIKLLEELCELSKEVVKVMECKESNVYNLLEEIADVYVMLEQIKKYYAISDDVVLKAIGIKIERALKKHDTGTV